MVLDDQVAKVHQLASQSVAFHGAGQQSGQLVGQIAVGQGYPMIAQLHDVQGLPEGKTTAGHGVDLRHRDGEGNGGGLGPGTVSGPVARRPGPPPPVPPALVGSDVQGPCTPPLGPGSGLLGRGKGRHRRLSAFPHPGPQSPAPSPHSSPPPHVGPVRRRPDLQAGHGRGIDPEMGWLLVEDGSVDPHADHRSTEQT